MFSRPVFYGSWLLGICRDSLHFAQRTYYIVRAAVEDGINESIKRARLLEHRILELVLGSKSSNHNNYCTEGHESLILYYYTSDDSTMAYWLDQITMIKSLTRLSTMLNSVPLAQKSASCARIN